MLLNRKASTDPSKETLNVWTASVPLGPASKLEMIGSQLFINCARTSRDYRLTFTEQDDIAQMTNFCKYVTIRYVITILPYFTRYMSVNANSSCIFKHVQILQHGRSPIPIDCFWRELISTYP